MGQRCRYKALCILTQGLSSKALSYLLTPLELPKRTSSQSPLWSLSLGAFAIGASVQNGSAIVLTVSLDVALGTIGGVIGAAGGIMSEPAAPLARRSATG